MTDNEGWIKHDGGPCPVPEDAWVQIKNKSGLALSSVYLARDWNWPDVSEYRLFAPVTAPAQDAAFIRETAALVLAGLAARGDWYEVPYAVSCDHAVNAAEALADKLKDRGL